MPPRADALSRIRARERTREYTCRPHRRHRRTRGFARTRRPHPSTGGTHVGGDRA